MDQSASQAKLLALAVSEWLLVLPASVLLLAALLRLLQPRAYEPARSALRQDLSGALASLRRHFAVLILGMGTLVAAVILAAVVAHLITD